MKSLTQRRKDAEDAEFKKGTELLFENFFLYYKILYWT
jgi:hypothetical protein